MADSPTPAPAPAAALNPLKSWSHPLGDRSNPLVQLTNLAEAVGGYYPLGRNGFWHGGIHFDPGTDARTDATHVRCIADGEVVAYRIDSKYPLSTLYNVSNEAFQAPFATGFVLVRHRLQAPKIEGSEAAPPELTFYSLYMHLKHWAAYQEDESLARPAYWPEGAELRVKQTVKDTFVGKPNTQGLNVRCRADHSHAHPAPVIDLLERGTTVTVSGEGAFRKLESPRGPASLMGEDGALRGYLAFQHLAPIEGELYRVNSSSLNVRAEPNSNAGTAILGRLPRGAEVTVSGDGDFRKLESVNQYVHFKSLEGQREPQAQDSVVILATPAAIKAGELIGHIGDTQDPDDAHPQYRLHIEVFSGQNVETFIRNSRDWAKDLPESGRTWLKFAKGTPVIAHQDSFNASHPPSPTAAGTPSGTDLLLPKSLLNGLRAEFKIKVPATGSEKARNWYRLDGLFNTAELTQLDGWVCEEVGVTPWFNPWSWEGYELIYNDSTPREELAYSMSAAHELDEQQQERYLPFIEQAKKGPLHKRLHGLVADGEDGMLTSDELQAGLRFPAVAQLISQLIIHYESEWFGGPQKWDQLDDLMGHSGSTPNPNWVASKERMRKLGWWGEVAAGLGLPDSGEVYHFHPIAFVSNFLTPVRCYCFEQGLVGAPCQDGVPDVTKEHFEQLATELGVEREVLRAIAVAETGDKRPFREYVAGKRHAVILYERHYMKRLLGAAGWSSVDINSIQSSEPTIVHGYVSGYSYGGYDIQYSRLVRARELDWDAASMSCSWGKFQVMGEYYKRLYNSVRELVDAQNLCALQHLQYYKVFLTKEKMLTADMRAKNWLAIAQKYNGANQVGYDTKIQDAYNDLKNSW